MPHLKALNYGKDESKELSCGSTSSICQGILKSDNLLHKPGFVKTQSLRTVTVDSTAKCVFLKIELQNPTLNRVK